MRFRNLLGSVASIALVAACASSTPPPSKSEQLSFLRGAGVVLKEEDVKEVGGKLTFPVGVCGAEFYYTGTDKDIPMLTVYGSEGVIEQISGGDNIGNVGKTAKTIPCLQADKEPSESK